MSDRLAKQTFFCCCFEVKEGWGMDWGGGGRVGVERNLNLLLTCRSKYCRSNLILRWEKRFQFCEICDLDLFFCLRLSLLVIFLYFISFRLFID